MASLGLTVTAVGLSLSFFTRSVTAAAVMLGVMDIVLITSFTCIVTFWFAPMDVQNRCCVDKTLGSLAIPPPEVPPPPPPLPLPEPLWGLGVGSDDVAEIGRAH